MLPPAHAAQLAAMSAPIAGQPGQGLTELIQAFAQREALVITLAQQLSKVTYHCLMVVEAGLHLHHYHDHYYTISSQD